MTTIITRLYPNQAAAEEVVSALREAGYQEREFKMVAGPQNSEIRGDQLRLREQMQALGVYETASKLYADHAADGAALVVVEAGVGRAKQAIEIVESHSPINLGLATEDVFQRQTSSSVIRQRRYGAGVLRNDPKFASGAMAPGLSRSSTPFSSALGLPLLSKKSDNRPLLTSGKPIIGMTTVIKRGKSRSLLRENTTPFSSLFGMRLISPR